MKKTAMIFYTVPSKMYGRMMEMKFDYPESVEQWGILEISLEGRSDGNPFTDYSVTQGAPSLVVNLPVQT